MRDLSPSYKKLTGLAYTSDSSRVLSTVVSYSEPLCKKCLHAESLHSEVVSQLPQSSGEIRRCTVAMCTCIVTWQRKTAAKAAQVH
jgi:hypothetical protein